MSEQQNSDNSILEGRSVAQPRPEQGIPQDFNEQARSLRDAADNQIVNNLQSAAQMNSQIEGAGQAYVDQINHLREDVQEVEAAFEARVDRLSSPYVLPPELEKVLRVARVLKKPLILEGEPGTGKTSLAYALAGHEDLPIIHAQCKSTTTAKDLLYTFDVVKRLQDAQLGKDVSDLSQYLRLGPLGKAFSSEEPVVLLIDEVDKAKRDFTNDLLHELDQMAFFIDETGEEVAAKHRPIVLITSNHERDLPEPVLRRSVYHFIDFPPPEQMTEIVRAHIPDANDKLLASAVQKFYEIRKVNMQKKPSTSEMLDWIRVLQAFGIEEIGQEIPFPETLIKYKEDGDLLLRRQREVKRDEESHKSVDARIVEAISSGEEVVRLKANRDVSKAYPLETIYTILANNGVPFTSAGGYDLGYRKFDIDVEGIRRVDKLIFSFDGDNALKVSQLLRDAGLIESEYITADDQIQFTEVLDGNSDFVKGKNQDGNIIYRLKDGRVVYEKAPITRKVMEGPFGGLGLNDMQVEGIINAGISSKEELLNKLQQEKGIEELLTIPGIGRKALVDIKKATQRQSSATSEHNDGEFPGKDLLTKPSRSQLYDDNDDE